MSKIDTKDLLRYTHCKRCGWVFGSSPIPPETSPPSGSTRTIDGEKFVSSFCLHCGLHSDWYEFIGTKSYPHSQNK